MIYSSDWIIRRRSACSFLLLLSLLAFLPACVATRPATGTTQTPSHPAVEAPEPDQLKNLIAESFRQSAVFKSSFTGFLMVDAHSRDTLYQQLADRYFTPASNTKLFTFYAATKMLGDSVPGIRYVTRGDSLIFWGTGDPTLFHQDLHGDRVFHFLKSRKEKLYYSDVHYQNLPFGPGWSWDDYNYYYSPERSPMPLYGNVVKFTLGSGNKLKLAPSLFRANVKTAPAGATSPDVVVRDLVRNQFTYYPKANNTGFPVEVPFRQSAALQVQLLSDTLRRPVQYVRRWPVKDAKTVYSFASDSLYRRMLQVSDNLLAEQILTLCGSALSDTLNTEKVIRHVTRTYLADLPDKPVWVDGSGLSRQNLFTPRSLVALLDKMYREIPPQRLFPLLAVGGRRGTLRNAYKAEPPFLFAKTGSLSHVYTLSGYLVTRSGRTLIFSFMNNNYAVSTATVRKEVERILTEIHLNYQAPRNTD